MKKILLVGEWKSPNLGDAVLCNCCFEHLKRNASDRYEYIKFDLSFGLTCSKIRNRLYSYSCRVIIPLFNDRNSTRVLGWIRSKLFIKHSLCKFKRIDGIVFCGGQIVLDYFCDCVNEISRYSNKKKIPILLNAIGGGKCTHRSQKIFKQVLESTMVKNVSVRDNFSFFSGLINRPICLVPDTGVLAGEIYDTQNREDKLIGLGSINMDLLNERMHRSVSENEVIDFWSNVILEIERRGLKWRFFTNGDHGDYLFAKSVLERIGRKATNKLLESRPVDDKQLVCQISKFEAIISFRLHSHIISYSLGIPSYGITWDSKVSDFFSMTENDNYSRENLLDFNGVCTFLDQYNNINVQNKLSEIVNVNLIDNLNKYLI